MRQDKKYNIIYADPHWDYDIKNSKKFNMGCADKYYKTMKIDEICNLNVRDISDNNCALFLWATFPKLQDAFKVIESWDFTYKTLAFLWIKIDKNNKPRKLLGFYTRSNAEICLLGIKGSMKSLDRSISQIVYSKLQEHSKKPDSIRYNIVKLFGDLPRIELFARQKYDGWDVYGNQLSNNFQKYI